MLLAAAGKPPSAEEQRLFEEGMKAMQAGDAAAADKAWRAGYAIAKDPAFLVHMGEAEEKAGQPAEAGESYRRYLRAAPDASDRAEIEQRLTRLGPAGAPPAAGRRRARGPGRLRRGPARRQMPGTPPAPPPRGRGAARRATTRPAGRPGASEDSGWNTYNITAWIATGATVLLLGTAAYYAASAGSAKDDVNQFLRYRDQLTGVPLEYQTVAARYEKAVRDGQHDDRVAKGALIVAAGTALVATAFFIVDGVRTPERHAERDRPRRPARRRSSVWRCARTAGARRAISALRWSF